MTRQIVPLLCAVALAGCGVHRLSTEMDAWVGKPEDALVSALGAPTRTADLSSGGKVLTYVTPWNTAAEGRQPVMRDCVRSFTISQQRIASWSANGCPSVYLKP